MAVVEETDAQFRTAVALEQTGRGAVSLYFLSSAKRRASKEGGNQSTGFFSPFFSPPSPTTTPKFSLLMLFVVVPLYFGRHLVAIEVTGKKEKEFWGILFSIRESSRCCANGVSLLFGPIKENLLFFTWRPCLASVGCSVVHE